MRQLTKDSFKDRRPVWSPDGNRIMFYSEGSGSYEFWTIKPDGSELTQVTHAPAEVKLFYWPRFFPDGKHLLGVGSDGTYIFDCPPKQEWNPEILPTIDNDKYLFIAFSISPEGQWLAGFTQPRNEVYINNVVVYSQQGREYQKLSQEGSLPVWLKDDEHFVYVGKKGLMRITRKTWKKNFLFSHQPNLFFGEVSPAPDNKMFYFDGMELESDIWMAELAIQIQ